jgi:flagellar basal-body rod protein FlgB
MTASNISNLLFEQLKFRSDKQKIISSNIANINTPKYKTKDINFEQRLQTNKNELKLMTTNINHIKFDNDLKQNKNKMNRFEVQGLKEQNDGNNVNLDDQISKMAQNQVIHNAISNSIKKDANWFKMVIDASSKN